MSSSLLDIFTTLPDRRRAQGKMYALAPVLMVSVLAVLSGATSYRKIHGFIDAHLSRFIAFLIGAGVGPLPTVLYGASCAGLMLMRWKPLFTLMPRC